MSGPTGQPPRPLRWTAVALVGVGLFLLLAAGGYLLYAHQARAGLKDLVAETPFQQPGQEGQASTGPDVGAPLATAEPSPSAVQEPVDKVGAPSDAQPSPPAQWKPLPSQFGSLYPGQQTDPLYWDSPLWAQPAPDLPLAAQYQPVDWEALPPAGTQLMATRIRIPLLDLDARVQDLEVQDLGDSRQYETPKFVVGHIPSTARPGERGNGYLFGHLESPIRNEGAIFQSLPKVPGLLRQGLKVYIILDTEAGSYLYQVVRTRVVPQTQLRLEDSLDPQITLVTCVPTRVYDQRLLVTAYLVGMKPAGQGP
ncbi:MAG: sortase [Chloroflexi bacterium]|nr:sortase [Chloroflexota bacterium]